MISHTSHPCRPVNHDAHVQDSTKAGHWIPQTNHYNMVLGEREAGGGGDGYVDVDEEESGRGRGG